MTISFLLGLLCSALIGLSLGLIGGGGSIITMPVLIYLFHVETHAAVGLSLAVVGATSLLGAALHHRNGNVNLRAAGLFAATGVIGAFLGTRLTYLLSPAALLLTFAGLMLVVSLRMLASGNHAGKENRKLNVARLLIAGLAVGALTGFLGVGGGFLIVPALVLFGGLGMKEAVGTSLLVISINSASGFLGHMQRGAFDWRMGALVTLCALAGAFVGTRYAHTAHPETLRKIFAVFVLLVALFLIYRNLPFVV